jgi:hypothetical protein
MTEMMERNSRFYLHITALGEIIHLMAEVDGVIESAGGWAVR